MLNVVVYLFIVINHIVLNMDASLGPDLANVRIDQNILNNGCQDHGGQSGMILEANVCHFL